MNERSYVEPPPHESTIDASDVVPVEVDLGFPVDSVEIEPHAFAGNLLRRCEKLIAIPEIGAEERVGDGVLVVAVVGIGNCSVV